MTPLHPIADKREARAPIEDMPTLFEDWWATSPRRNRNLIGYGDKKVLAYDAFEAGFATAEQQRISEGEVRAKALEEAAAKVDWFMAEHERRIVDAPRKYAREYKAHIDACKNIAFAIRALISSPVAPDGEGWQKSALLTLLAQDGYESLTAFTDDLLAEEDEARLDTLIGEAVTYLHHLAATHTGITPEEIG